MGGDAGEGLRRLLSGDLLGGLLLLGHALGVGQHELDPVLLVDLGGAGVVVDGNNIGVGVVLLQLADHTLAHDMVGQKCWRKYRDEILV